MAAIYQTDHEAIDEQSAALIIQLQLEDTEYLFSALKGKRREDESSDAEFALRLYKQELEKNASIISDRRMTQSIASAVQTDGVILRETLSEEESATRDREMARHLINGSEVSRLPVSGDNAQALLDDELLAKLQALYVSHVDDIQLPPDHFDMHDESTEIAESSSFAAGRRARPASINRRCVACGEDKMFFDVARVPCQHEYCRDCLINLFQTSLTDESLFPPRCCRQSIAVGSVRLFLTSDLVHSYEMKKIEFETPNRTYCSSPLCSLFIRNENISGEVATCLQCGTLTCTSCKAADHGGGDCPNDLNLQQVLEVAAENGWQRCSSCWRLVELDHGCNHMTCRCGAQFCYVCGERWKNCGCQQWDEHRLLARATQIVERDLEPVLPPPPPAQEPPDVEDLPRVEELLEPQVNLIPSSRDVVLAQVMQNLRVSHECSHGRWRYIPGPHNCEECHHYLRKFIFECYQCQLQACNRCRRNRL